MSGPAEHGAAVNISPEHGAQRERTRLAWRRTVLSGTVCALLLVRLAFSRGLDDAAALALALTLLSWLALLLVAQRRIRAMERQHPTGVARTMAAVTVSCVLMGLLGVLLIGW